MLSNFTKQKLVALAWNFVTVTYDDATGNVTFNINNLQDANNLKLNHRLSSSKETSIGKYSTDWYFYGYIDEISAFKKVLSASEINVLYASASL